MDEYRASREFYASIAACLLAGDVKATVVENRSHFFVKVHLISGGSVLWSLVDPVGGSRGWVYTAVSSQGEVEFGSTGWLADTEVEQISKNIALFDYEDALDFPMEHPADLEHDLATT